MRASTLRTLLLFFGWISFPGLLLATAVTIFGPYLSVPGTILSFNSYPYTLFLSYSLGIPAITAISFWAAHNLKSLSFLKPKTLAKFLLLSAIFNILAILFSIIALPLEISLYGEYGGGPAVSLGNAVASFFYGITSALLLLFARKQILAKLAGDTIKEQDLGETFS